MVTKELGVRTCAKCGYEATVKVVSDGFAQDIRGGLEMCTKNGPCTGQWYCNRYDDKFQPVAICYHEHNDEVHPPRRR